MAIAPETGKRKDTRRRADKPVVSKSRSKTTGPQDLAQALLTSLPQAVAALDGRRRIMFTNAVFDRVHGKSNVGDRLSDYFNPPGLKNLFKQASITNKAVEERELIIPAKKPEDPEISYSVIVTPHSDAKHKTKFLVLIDDVTEGSDREDRMIANSRLVSVGEMAAGVALRLFPR